MCNETFSLHVVVVLCDFWLHHHRCTFPPHFFTHIRTAHKVMRARAHTHTHAKPVQPAHTYKVPRPDELRHTHTHAQSSAGPTSSRAQHTNTCARLGLLIRREDSNGHSRLLTSKPNRTTRYSHRGRGIGGRTIISILITRTLSTSIPCGPNDTGNVVDGPVVGRTVTAEP